MYFPLFTKIFCPVRKKSSIKIVLINVCTLYTPEVYNIKSPQFQLMVVIMMMMMLILIMVMIFDCNNACAVVDDDYHDDGTNEMIKALG